MARAALDHLKLDQVLFVPTGAPRYRDPARASGEDRVAMLERALAAEKRFALDTRELKPGASGYTVDTLRELRSELGAVELYLLLGADQYEKLPTWHRPEEVQRLAKIAVFGRPGVELKDNVQLVPMQPMDISASKVRALAGQGGDLAQLVPLAVANYIARRRLYYS
jgi:nicotinate-nucleotide adenylyltransferase